MFLWAALRTETGISKAFSPLPLNTVLPDAEVIKKSFLGAGVKLFLTGTFSVPSHGKRKRDKHLLLQALL